MPTTTASRPRKSSGSERCRTAPFNYWLERIRQNRNTLFAGLMETHSCNATHAVRPADRPRAGFKACSPTCPR
jgi:hypothetical protein